MKFDLNVIDFFISSSIKTLKTNQNNKSNINKDYIILLKMNKKFKYTEQS